MVSIRSGHRHRYIELVYLAHLKGAYWLFNLIRPYRRHDEKLLRSRKAGQRLYYQEVKPEIDWQWMLVIGVVIGAFIAALLSGICNGNGCRPYGAPASAIARFCV
jgi:hypothetical protein